MLFAGENCYLFMNFYIISIKNGQELRLLT